MKPLDIKVFLEPMPATQTRVQTEYRQKQNPIKPYNYKLPICNLDKSNPNKKFQRKCNRCGKDLRKNWLGRICEFCDLNNRLGQMEKLYNSEEEYKRDKLKGRSLAGIDTIYYGHGHKTSNEESRISRTYFKDKTLQM